MKITIFAACLILISGFVFSTSAQTYTFVTQIPKDTTGYRISENIILEINKRVPFTLKLEYRPTERALAEFKEGLYAGDFARSNVFHQLVPDAIMIPEPVIETPFVVFAIRDDIKIDGWASLKPYRLVFKRGTKFVEISAENNVKSVYGVNDIESALRILTSGRADVFVEAPLLVLSILEKDEFKNSGIRMLKPPVSVLNVYTFLNEKHADLVEPYTKALKDMKADGAHQKILQTTK